jgi:hypothetical protein
MSAEVGVLTTWSPQIFETSALDLMSRDDVAGRAQMFGSSRTETASDQPLEDIMDTTSATFLACGAFFVLSFAMIGAFWFVERLRGASAPHV